jgi:hypothetical protein
MPCQKSGLFDNKYGLKCSCHSKLDKTGYTMSKIKNEITNFYNVIDKKLLLKPENHNFYLHHLKIPFRSLIVAPFGTGKTNFLVNLVQNFCSGKKGTFKTINVITRNKDELLYDYLESKGVCIKEGLKHIPILDDIIFKIYFVTFLFNFY